MGARRWCCARSVRVGISVVLLMGCSDSHGATVDAATDSSSSSRDAGDAELADTGTDTGRVLPAPFDDVARRLAEAVCAALVHCIPGWQELVGGSCEESERLSLADALVARWQQSVAQGRAVFDADAFESCLAAVRDVGCGEEDLETIGECRRAVRGLVPESGDCWQAFDCAPDLTCVHSAFACLGRCEVTPSAGQSCLESFRCASGLDCDADDICRPAASVGEPCNGPMRVECGRGLYCVGASSSGPGTCVVVDRSFSASVGEGCDPRVGPRCAAPAVCALQTYDLDAGVGRYSCEGPYALGDSCRLAAPSGCPMGSACHDIDVRIGRLVGQCKRVPTAGQTCDASSDLLGRAACAVGLQCNADLVCQAARGLGDACDLSTDCANGQRCSGGLCELILCE